jgi:hypothetical protein
MLMDDYFPCNGKESTSFHCLNCRRDRSREANGQNRIRRIRLIIPVLLMGLFFYAFYDQNVSARTSDSRMGPEIIDPLERLSASDKCLGVNSENNAGSICRQPISAEVTRKEQLPASDKPVAEPTQSKEEEPEAQQRATVDPEVVDPMERLINDNKCIDISDAEEESICRKIELIFEDKPAGAKDKKNDERIAALGDIVGGYPMEEMVPYIAEQPKDVAGYLIGIAKIESDWGKHSPSKNGQHCYNYWGYKGNYNLAPSGYSCFDSAKQAVEIVGGRIKELIDKRIDTPERMVVWKCGSSCAGHDKESVNRWISNVKNYYGKASQ